MSVRSITFTNAQDVDLGPTHDGFTGRWLIQVTAYSGLTAITPKLSADGVTYNTRAITPFDNSADVITITTTGAWLMDAACGVARLSSSGVGSATVLVQPAVG